MGARKKLSFKPEISRVKLNAEQAVLACNCYTGSKSYTRVAAGSGQSLHPVYPLFMVGSKVVCTLGAPAKDNSKLYILDPNDGTYPSPYPPIPPFNSFQMIPNQALS